MGRGGISAVLAKSHRSIPVLSVLLSTVLRERRRRGGSFYVRNERLRPREPINNISGEGGRERERKREEEREEERKGPMAAFSE